jgi:hypothetical protein
MAVIAGCVSTGIIDAEGAPVLAPAPGITAVTFIFRESGDAASTTNADHSQCLTPSSACRGSA